MIPHSKPIDPGRIRFEDGAMQYFVCPDCLQPRCSGANRHRIWVDISETTEREEKRRHSLARQLTFHAAWRKQQEERSDD